MDRLERVPCAFPSASSFSFRPEVGAKRGRGSMIADRVTEINDDANVKGRIGRSRIRDDRPQREGPLPRKASPLDDRDAIRHRSCLNEIEARGDLTFAPGPQGLTPIVPYECDHSVETVPHPTDPVAWVHRLAHRPPKPVPVTPTLQREVRVVPRCPACECARPGPRCWPPLYRRKSTRAGSRAELSRGASSWRGAASTTRHAPRARGARVARARMDRRGRARTKDAKQVVA